MSRWLMFLPPVLFLALAGMFYAGMQRDNPQDLPSMFIGQSAPVLPQAGLEGYKQARAAEFHTGEVTLVNFWASWCPPCRAEHQTLMDLAARGIRIIGVNIADDPVKARDYLAKSGNPFISLAVDPKGRDRVEWGVSAPPETFIIGKDGRVELRYTGPLVGSAYTQRFLPALEAALAR